MGIPAATLPSRKTGSAFATGAGAVKGICPLPESIHIVIGHSESVRWAVGRACKHIGRTRAGVVILERVISGAFGSILFPLRLAPSNYSVVNNNFSTAV